MLHGGSSGTLWTHRRIKGDRTGHPSCTTRQHTRMWPWCMQWVTRVMTFYGCITLWRQMQRSTRWSRRDLTVTLWKRETSLMGEPDSIKRSRKRENQLICLLLSTEYWHFGELHDEKIRDRVVVGLWNTTLSEKLQLDAELTLEKAVTAAVSPKKRGETWSLCGGDSQREPRQRPE